VSGLIIDVLTERTVLFRFDGLAVCIMTTDDEYLGVTMPDRHVRFNVPLEKVWGGKFVGGTGVPYGEGLSARVFANAVRVARSCGELAVTPTGEHHTVTFNGTTVAAVTQTFDGAVVHLGCRAVDIGSDMAVLASGLVTGPSDAVGIAACVAVSERLSKLF
jgi:hypothetical protein